MATLLTLPNEVLLEIINELLPDDIPHLALSCKHMRALSQRRLTWYRECRKKYHVVKIHGYPERDSESDLPELLQHVISDQRIAFYPRSMIIEIPCSRLQRLHADPYYLGNRFNDRFNNEAKTLESIEKLNSIVNHFKKAATRKGDRTTDQWLRADKVLLYQPTKWGTTLGLLLTTFPNIEILEVEVRYPSARLEQVQDILWNAVEMNRGPGHTGPTILTKLKTVSIDASEFPYRENGDFLACCALFPSVERLVGRGIESLQPLESNLSRTISEYLRLWHPSLAVTEIILQESRLSYDFFSQFLRGITRLKRFTYTYSARGSSWERTAATDAYQLIDLLLLHSKSTLEYLELKGLEPQNLAFLSHNTGGCLRDFEALKEVGVDVALWMISEEYHQALCSKPECIGYKEYIVFPLVEMLPSCVEMISLAGPVEMMAVEPLLTDLTTAKGRRLRNLKTIVFRGVIVRWYAMLEVAERWVQDCAKVGICLEFEWIKQLSDNVSYGRYPSQHMKAW